MKGTENKTTEKYCVDLIKGNSKQTLATFDTIEDAFAYGEQLRANHPEETGFYVCNGYMYAGEKRFESRWRQYKEW